MKHKLLHGFIASSCAILAMTTLTDCNSADKNTVFYPEKEYAEYPVAENFNSELEIDREGGHFSLWSPKAEAARVNLYENDSVAEPMLVSELKLDEKSGLWQGTIVIEGVKDKMSPGEFLYGKYYTFQIMHNGKWLDETPGIWTKATNVNGKRAAIIALNNTNPEGWEKDNGPELKNQNDAIIYEMHFRDFTCHDNSGITNKGKFIAMTENGTRSANGEKTGIDHLKELGVTHVHILPSYDYNSIDETKLEQKIYNWGYDPYNYNVPEGSYSTNPYDPACRINEMKTMIMALHNSGIGVIMDVVYNHTALGDDSNFSLTVPGYFYRHNPDGSYSNASGCGNETASDRKMVRDYIINSVKYWTNEYHIDGFRFDLMAIHDTETMTRLATEIRQINPDAVIYGEGWTAGDSPLPAEQRALKESVSKMPGNAVFSDDIRDAIKGHYSKSDDKGFATGKAGNEETVKLGIAGAVKHPQIDYSKCNYAKAPYASSPLQIINYVSCHDDLSLTDKLAKSMPEATVAERQRAAKLAQTIVFTSQGTPFMFAGEEIFRDKKGVHNSYNAKDSINAINWNMKRENRELFNYYKNLIELRKKHPAFRMVSAEDVAKHLVFDEIDTPLLISYSLVDNANGDAWKEIKVIFNGSDNEMEIAVPEKKWTVIAHDGKLNEKGLVRSKGGNIKVAPRSATILAEK